MPTFYRYEAHHQYDGIKLILREFTGLKETPCGWWIGVNDSFILQYSDRRRWVSKTSQKRYAYPTKREALYGYQARTKRYIKILSDRLDNAKCGLVLAKIINGGE